MKKEIMVLAMLAMILPATGAISLGSQAFPQINLSDSTASKAEMEIAVSGLPSPSILPGNPVYGLKSLKERVQLAFAGNEKKAELHLKFAKERLSEANSLMEKDMNRESIIAIEGFEKSVESYERLNPANEHHDILVENSLIILSMMERFPKQSEGLSHSLDILDQSGGIGMNLIVEGNRKFNLSQETQADDAAEKNQVMNITRQAGAAVGKSAKEANNEVGEVVETAIEETGSIASKIGLQ